MDKLEFKYKTYQQILDYLISLIPKEEFLSKAPRMAELHNELTANTEIYYYLSKIIPKDYTVINFCAGYNAHAYFFIEHKKFIAVNPIIGVVYDEMFCPPNCDIYRMATKKFIRNIEYPRRKVFAICTPISDGSNGDIELVHSFFNNVYTRCPR